MKTEKPESKTHPFQSQFYNISAAVLRSDLSPELKILYAYLCHVTRATGVVGVSNGAVKWADETIGNHLGVKYSTVRNQIARLIQLGLIKKIEISKTSRWLIPNRTLCDSALPDDANRVAPKIEFDANQVAPLVPIENNSGANQVAPLVPIEDHDGANQVATIIPVKSNIKSDYRNNDRITNEWLRKYIYNWWLETSGGYKDLLYSLTTQEVTQLENYIEENRYNTFKEKINYVIEQKLYTYVTK
jgi:hypothetical protein